VRQEITSRVERSIQESLAVKHALLEDRTQVRLIAAVARAFIEALQGGHKILLFGNGGSAADAQHIAAEFVGRFQLERPPLPALALTTDSSALTGIANDYLYENVFARQVEALGSAGDVAVGISTSGRSLNVLKGLAAAKAKGMVTVGLAGKNAPQLGEQTQYCICVPSEATPRIQEAHILIGHILAEITEADLVQGAALAERRDGVS
jgi:D-sedoheptulose 7-phosphate isomerase